MALKVASFMGKHCLLCSCILSWTLLGSVSISTFLTCLGFSPFSGCLQVPPMLHWPDYIMSISYRAPSSGTYSIPSGSWAAPSPSLTGSLGWPCPCPNLQMCLDLKSFGHWPKFSQSSILERFLTKFCLYVKKQIQLYLLWWLWMWMLWLLLY